MVLSIQRNNFESVHVLISQKGIDIRKKDSMGKTPLMIAAEEGSFEVINLIMPLSDINEKDTKNKNALHYATILGNEKCVNSILSSPEIDINAQDSHGWTSLHYAVQYGYVRIVNQFLQNERININVKDLDGNTPISLAMSEKRKSILSMLKDFVNVS